MSDSVESVDIQDEYECINGIYILRSNEDEEIQIEKKGNFKITDYFFYICKGISSPENQFLKIGK